jgi:hypothetical protein
MIRHVFSVLCQRLLVDPATGVFSLVDCVERILLPPVEVEPGKTLLVPVGMRILSLWTRDPPDEPSAARARLSLQTPTGATLPGGEIELAFAEHRNARTDTALQFHPFTGPGRYWHVIELQQTGGEWQEVARLPLDLDFTPMTPSSPPPA